MTSEKTNHQIHLTSRPDGVPSKDNFTLTEAAVPEISPGEFLVRNEWISVDPYMRGRMNEGASYVEPFGLNEPLEGGCVGKVVSSMNDTFPEGSYVLGNMGWRDLWKSDGSGIVAVDPEIAPVENFLGVLGMTGLTAYVGLLHIGRLKEGDAVFVSAASGAVGSIVCQIAKIKGCRVVGSAGSAKKIAWLKEEAGIDDAFNYHDVDDVSARLAESFPSGIDLYFDNVGGDHLEGAIDNMNPHGTIVCCGMISGYNDKSPEPGPSNLPQVIGKRLRMEGFIVRDHQDLQEEFQKEMAAWIESGKMTWKTTITEGLENAPGAFIDLFEGDKMGKALVKI